MLVGCWPPDNLNGEITRAGAQINSKLGESPVGGLDIDVVFPT